MINFDKMRRRRERFGVRKENEKEESNEGTQNGREREKDKKKKEKMKESLAEIMVARSIEKLVSRQREQVARGGGALCYTYCSSSSGRSRSWAARRTAVHCESEADADAQGRWPEGVRGAGSAPPWPVDDDRDDDECCPLGRIDLGRRS